MCKVISYIAQVILPLIQSSTLWYAKVEGAGKHILYERVVCGILLRKKNEKKQEK